MQSAFPPRSGPCLAARTTTACGRRCWSYGRGWRGLGPIADHRRRDRAAFPWRVKQKLSPQSLLFSVSSKTH
jgi:hypothetical protein